MADDVFSTITDDIVSALNGKSITYGGSTKTLTCEYERLVNVIGDRSPIIIVSGPTIEVMNRAHLVNHCTLHYLLRFSDDTVNDEYDPDSSVDPITKVTKKVLADLICLLMVDRTRGGLARNTMWTGGGYYFDDSDLDTPIFNIFLQLEITAFVRDIDPYYSGG